VTEILGSLLHYGHVLVALSISAWLVAKESSWFDHHREQRTNLEDEFSWRGIAYFLVVTAAISIPLYWFLGWVFRKL
jgi:low temperature requirement protein LtrA